MMTRLTLKQCQMFKSVTGNKCRNMRFHVPLLAALSIDSTKAKGVTKPVSRLTLEPFTIVIDVAAAFYLCILLWEAAGCHE